MLFDLKKLRHALAVARLGSFSLAATELNLTQPTLSRSIASLEAIWGIRLFERDRTGVMPTRIGADMLREAAQLVAAARTLDFNMQQRAAARAGNIAFGMSGLTGAIYMGSLLARIADAAPDLQVTGKIATLADLIADIRDDRLEFGIFSETEMPDETDMEWKIIGQVPIGFIVRAGHPLADNDEVCWDDITRFPLASSTPTRIPVLPKKPTIICDDYGIARELMLASDTVWLSSWLVVQTDIAAGRAQALKVLGDKISGSAHLALIFPRNRLNSPSAQLVINSFNAILLDMSAQA